MRHLESEFECGSCFEQLSHAKTYADGLKSYQEHRCYIFDAKTHERHYFGKEVEKPSFELPTELDRMMNHIASLRK